MKMHNLLHIARSLSERLQEIDYNQLPISDYNKQYIGNLKPAMHYYMKIYSTCLSKGFDILKRSPQDITFVDYGGGSGFLSILAKSAGVGKVIYLDLNPKSVETIRILKKETGIGPDIILHGNSDTLADWCKENNIHPDLLIATDLIEHVYDLKTFFKDLASINPKMQMIFTTASTPFNPYVKRRLHRLMDNSEAGTAEIPNYYTLRKEYIEKNYPNLSVDEINKWTQQTRGLIYHDIDKAIKANQQPELKDAHNTCDPASGNWTERILPIEDYRSLVKAHNYSLKVDKGFYNTDRNNSVSSIIFKCINLLIRLSGKGGFLIAPFIFLSCIRQRSES
ncbi:class I SAM-dependent methyltransferase [uncultured Parabacteroides sp.]|uniref:class I SAM-dependent methyltransferase n=1 Tax=uncultured Parabacteroides sp. TaxID=512312 RepID=UPI0028060EB2|nr:class I SAM-dependent methyltransferase [uncultured Parabacteroides sp.]